MGMLLVYLLVGFMLAHILLEYLDFVNIRKERTETPGRTLNSLVGLGKVGMEGNVPHGEDPLVLQSELN